MKPVRKIELLAPAKNKEGGMEAILHGADAVYIGVDGFSARAAAGNSVEDIGELTAFAHRFNAKVYAALNIILKDTELAQVEKLIWTLYRLNVDAVIVQDMGILQLNLPPVPLHASTQTDNRTVDKVRFLEAAGFSRVVLARELSIGDIAAISSQTKAPLEVFVHGALCVSYSGQCYISQAITGRSANRGECAQICRLPFDLIDSEGKIIRENAHLLSMKDLNMSERLEALLDAGVSSLKIEGRLKDLSYVKNVTAAYRQKLDAVFARRPEFVRSSSGKSYLDFQPDLAKSFNRGFTDYFSQGRQHDIWSFESPKSMGEYIGTVKERGHNCLSINTRQKINNGDGLCFIDGGGLNGFRVNRAEGNRIFPAQMPDISVGMKVYRNCDHEFEMRLLRRSAERKIAARISIKETLRGFALEIIDEDENFAAIAVDFDKQRAQKPQEDNIRTQLMKTGNTVFEISEVGIRFADELFIPSSMLGEWRKRLIAKLESLRKINYRQEIKPIKPSSQAFPQKELNYLGNVMNEKSRSFFAAHNVKVLQPAFEQKPQKNVPLMFTRHCLKFALGWCPRETKEKTPYTEPLYLRTAQSQFRLKFDCAKCEMQVVEE
ncbi:MAG: U32 family peptidase [Dysgonamonadaceae bacterium]|jgi:putative protease|nr:U32 family peptidase [Dysgonamonadaceae bacterium]